MFLALDTNEQEITDAAADFLGGEFPLERLHDEYRDPDQLKKFSQLGWLGLSAPEAAGGSGLSVVEEMLFFLEMGRVLGPIEVLAQILAVAVTTSTEPEICLRLINGDARVALVVEQQRDGGVRLIGGEKPDYALAVNPGNATLFELNAKSCHPVPCLDRSVTMYLGTASLLQQVAVSEGHIVWLKAQVNVSAMMLGVAARALDMIVEYAKERQTFGRPIGAYQAVRHPCADMALRVEAARCQLFYAATALRDGHHDAPMQVDAARLLSERAAKANTDANIQLHGGIGVTDEFSAHLLLKRANLLWRLLGSGKNNMKSLLDLNAK